MGLFSKVKFVINVPHRVYDWYMNSSRRIAFGRWGHPTYYLIRVEYSTAGLMAIAKSTLQHIIFAEEKSYVPIVDLKTCRCQYHGPGEVNKVNVWNRFFCQPAGVEVDDIPPHSCVVQSAKWLTPTKRHFIDVDMILPLNRDKLTRVAKQVYKWIRFSPEVDAVLSREYEQFRSFCGEEKVLGVLCRGTDYLQLRPAWHPVQPEPSDVVEKVREICEKFGIKHIFLATEDYSLRKMFEASFPDAILPNSQRLIKFDERKYLSEVQKDGWSYFDDPVRYLAAIYILSRCNFFVGGRTSGSLFAFLMSPWRGFEYEYVFDMGNYPGRC